MLNSRWTLKYDSSNYGMRLTICISVTWQQRPQWPIQVWRGGAPLSLKQPWPVAAWKYYTSLFKHSCPYMSPDFRCAFNINETLWVQGCRKSSKSLEPALSSIIYTLPAPGEKINLPTKTHTVEVGDNLNAAQNPEWSWGDVNTLTHSSRERWLWRMYGKMEKRRAS